uniref:Telomere repeat binding bouquet formation protein 2 n=1 Tax=Nothoprocta perdicaria TaxID=30464 RepID=A0A8C6Z7N8_NOTPE
GRGGHGAWGCPVSPPGLMSLSAAEAEGGTLARREDAHFLFSSDATHPDTRRYQDYLDGRATVFHSCYLSAWANTSSEMKQSVALGHFILPPACLQEEIRRKIGSFIWEQMDDPPSFFPPAALVLSTKSSPGFPGWDWHFLLAGYPAACDMKKYAGELRDFTPGTSGYTAYWIQNDTNIRSGAKNKRKR